ncbi:MAG TPA: nucleotide pyrophosphohydrolase [Burkholderiales bacterium]|nr:nucleotide pyrophosphohydrolase [Burkholderiales bacterium]
MQTDRMAQLAEALRKFAQERNWEPFHSPKNLAMALTVEAAELQEKFQWLTEEESRRLEGEPLEAVKDEVADVFLYTLRMAQVLGVDLLEAAEAKMVKNARKYPAGGANPPAPRKRK